MNVLCVGEVNGTCGYNLTFVQIIFFAGTVLVYLIRLFHFTVVDVLGATPKIIIVDNDGNF